MSGKVCQKNGKLLDYVINAYKKGVPKKKSS